MSSFERRGLPFRDVFDSSFDSIVQVNYLDAEKARRLLHTRVIGIPIPFLDFCYCMAGGLPRDLVRVCRELFRVRKQNPDTEPLSKLTCKLIESDIKRKLHAVSVAAKDMAWGSEANELLRKIRQLEMAVKPVDNSSEDHPYLSTVLVPWRLSLTSFANFLESTPQMPITDGTSKPHELIASLSGELGVYLYYSATLLEFFDERTLSEDILRDESYQVMVDQLAAARQYLAVSPSIAEAMITEFRAHYNMPLIR
jgi:hypothetical protein